MATGVEELLDMLFEMIDEAKSMPLSSDKCILERDKALDLLDEIRAQFPMELAEAKKLIAARTEYIASAKREADAIRNIIAGHTMKMQGRVEREKETGEQHVSLTMEMNNLDSRIRLLSEMEKEYEGFNKAVRTVMQASERKALRGVRGPVANLMKVGKKYAVAIEIALGAGLQNIVVEREEDAKSAIQLLKQRDGGRATFLPLSSIRGEALRDARVQNEYGYVGLASELVEYDREYDGIFKNLLGRTVVAQDLDAAISIANKFGHRFRIVTLDGQVLNAGGSMTGGSVSRSAGILSRANEIERLQAQQKEAAAALDKLRGLRAVRRGDHAGRHGARDLLRVRGAREHGNRMLPARLLRDDLRHTQMRAALDALCDREQRHAIRQVRRCLLRHRAQRERRRCEHDQLGVSQAIQVICDLQFNRKLHTGK